MEKLKIIYSAVREILPDGELFLVGGAVRDAHMKLAPKDFDFTGNLDPDTVEKLVKSAGRRAYTTGKRFGTIGFKVPYQEVVQEVNPDGSWGEPYEVTKYEYIEYTTYRTEYYNGKSRKPEVVFAKTLKEDLSRRDFTFNAMAFDGNKILDFYGGKLDIYAKQIKTVGMPKDRIMEDPLRIFRAARFAARYGFKIDPNFIGKARQLADRIYDVSVERWVQELDKLLTADHAYQGMTELDRMGVLIRVLPEIYNGDGEPLIRDPQYSRIKDTDEAWAYLLGLSQEHVMGVGKGARLTKYVNSGIASRLKFSNSRRGLILDNRKIKE